MRSFLAGFLLLLLPSLALAQARGEVESIGFQGLYRPGCWTPMVVKLVPTTGGNFTGRIEVMQEDLDRDQVIFTRQISLSGNPPNGSPVEQRFWMYFMPQPKRGEGELNESVNIDKLTDIVKVRLCSDSGKELVKLPMTQALKPVESLSSGMYSAPRGRKVVLCVFDHNQPNILEYANTDRGLTEDVGMSPVRDIATGLPDSVIGYDSIDGILWSDADPTKLSTDQIAAIEDFVRRGGKLVFTQDTTTNQWQRNNVRFPLLMPVNVRGVEERDDVGTLRELAKAEPRPPGISNKPWDLLRGPFKCATCEVKEGATVILWQKDEKGNLVLDSAGKGKPYAVRLGFGAGAVTWVAQDLGDRQILGDRDTTAGWVYVWDKFFDWPNEPVSSKNKDPKSPQLVPYEGGSTWELGRSFLKHMDLPSTSAALIGIAVLFFLVYWVAAGPGSYLVLLKKGKAMMSWFTFAAIAIGATGVTVGIVKLVLRGAPQMRHVSLVRVIPGEPSVVHSNFGLYIPRDGEQRIELKDAAPNRASYITAFNLHPVFNTESFDFPARQTYLVPVKELHEPDREVADPKVIRVPYRSTLKKFQARWVGNSPELPGGLDGSLKLVNDDPRIKGTLTNNTGHDLSMVYLVVNHPYAIDRGDGEYDTRDMVLFISSWPKSTALKFDELFKIGGIRDPAVAPYIKNTDPLFDSSNPSTVYKYRGYIHPDRAGFASWTEYWYAQNNNEFRKSNYMETREYTENDPLNPRTFPLLSFYDRLPIPKNSGKDNIGSRFDMLRRGVRYMDMSSAVSGGNMAVIAVSSTADEKLPFPLEVQGDRIEGKGVIYYQFVVPVDRSAVPAAPTTRPTATQPSKG